MELSTGYPAWPPLIQVLHVQIAMKAAQLHVHATGTTLRQSTVGAPGHT